ncbi:hypothetical protein [Planococcus lenghuensis]|uniref:Uncharacterized protein n=1 Tax=Planococcus lenghuensis TaxID=2213202 RepID=A0A1Q2KZG1_9BACL|nr:hypothetical protein [Planococcus lenghuensis]AQQ53588.1 hypothetical protein B0X71_11225 [Planococcus lenghuensis]
MKLFSWLSYCLTFIGLLLLGLDWVIYAYVEPLVLAGSTALIAGAVFSLIAFLRREKSGRKFISLSVFIILAAAMLWFEPPAAATMLTWLENKV